MFYTFEKVGLPKAKFLICPPYGAADQLSNSKISANSKTNSKIFWDNNQEPKGRPLLKKTRSKIENHLVTLSL
ncbi:MAG: hypothetical protein AN484_26995 [Aphanizomenon flos-aquae WA102]|uniref:Uncharacterized protein n=1 Tax=Aphanizomenon flos-aquae WA102 TaxID=1710896 RepID=A0A1B7W9Y0_APHFL|nr:MAG: hypothetical protein AN484_26995 [Aphanizomenon flos-aquae WA102]